MLECGFEHHQESFWATCLLVAGTRLIRVHTIYFKTRGNSRKLQKNPGTIRNLKSLNSIKSPWNNHKTSGNSKKLLQTLSNSRRFPKMFTFKKLLETLGKYSKKLLEQPDTPENSRNLQKFQDAPNNSRKLQETPQIPGISRKVQKTPRNS